MLLCLSQKNSIGIWNFFFTKYGKIVQKFFSQEKNQYVTLNFERLYRISAPGSILSSDSVKEVGENFDKVIWGGGKWRKKNLNLVSFFTRMNIILFLHSFRWGWLVLLFPGIFTGWCLNVSRASEESIRFVCLSGESVLSQAVGVDRWEWVVKMSKEFKIRETIRRPRKVDDDEDV